MSYSIGVEVVAESAGAIRERIWASLMRARVAVYPLPCRGHHPNFRGAGVAAAKLASYLLADGWLGPGDTVLSYPDYVLRPLRRELLKSGVSVVVPSQYRRHWLLLQPDLVEAKQAATIRGAERQGQALTELPPVRLALVACVAFDLAGRALDKGYGFKLPAIKVPAVALAHPLQQIEAVPEANLHLNLVATPEKVCNLASSGASPVVA